VLSDVYFALKEELADQLSTGEASGGPIQPPALIRGMLPPSQRPYFPLICQLIQWEGES